MTVQAQQCSDHQQVHGKQSVEDAHEGQPLPWSIFRNDLNLRDQISIYANDRQIYETDEDLQMMKQKLEANTVVKTPRWYTNNLLKKNVTNTEQ